MAVTESELFKDYEQDLERLSQDIDKQLEGAGGTQASSVQKCLDEAERLVGEAEKSLRQLEMEAKTMPPDQKREKEPRVKKLRDELGQRKKALSAARSAANRQSLLGEEGEHLGAKSRRDRERLLDVDDSLRRSSSKLDEAHRQALETEQIGIDVMSDLRTQRDVIRHTQQSVSDIGDHVARAKQTLGVMGRRAMANRGLTYFAVGSMVLMLVLAVYYGMQAEEEKVEEATMPGFSRATDRVCTGAAYTSNMAVGCNGWSGITEAECQRFCDSNAQAEGCPAQLCSAAAFYTADAWCHLYTGPECAARTPAPGVVTFRKVERTLDGAQADAAAPPATAPPAAAPPLAQAPPFSPAGGGRLLEAPA